MRAKLRYAKISPQKARLVANLIRGLSAEEAAKILSFNKLKAALLIRKVLWSAMENASHNFSIEHEDLEIDSICIDEGPTAKRFQARARGRGDRVLKRSCHIMIVLRRLDGEAN